jgi:hypothetical protein
MSTAADFARHSELGDMVSNDRITHFHISWMTFFFELVGWGHPLIEHYTDTVVI